MPAIKRQASDSFSSSSQGLVKRQKSSSDLNNGSALAFVGGAQHGALVQSVCLPHQAFAALEAEHWRIRVADGLDMGRLCERVVYKLPSWS